MPDHDRTARRFAVPSAGLGLLCRAALFLAAGWGWDGAAHAQSQPPSEAPNRGRAPGSAPGRLLFRPLADVETDIAPPAGPLPENVAAAWTGEAEPIDFRGGTRAAQGEYPFEVATADFYHQPLYFEEYAAERYGHSHGPLQPAVSAAHFFATFPVLPYKMAAEWPHAPVRTTGPYRPGVGGPVKPFLPPLRPVPGLVEAGVVTGMILLIP